MVLVFTMDSESRNKAAKELLEEKKNENTIDSYLALSQCLPDPFHVGHVIENGYGINPVQLTTLRNDPHLTALLVEHLKVAVCRNRDRMDVDSMLFFKIIFAVIITFFFLLHTIYNTNITYATNTSYNTTNYYLQYLQ